MKIAVLFLIACVCGYLAFSAYDFNKKLRISRLLVQRAVPFRLKGERGVSVLVLGDSTAVGVGADKPEDSLAALLAGAVHATQVDNWAISGARVKDLAREVQEIRKEKYNYILIGIGGNDVIRFGDANATAAHLATILSGLPVHNHLIVYMAGNVGATQLFPRVLNPEYTKRTLAFHEAFAPVVAAAGGTYVNLYRDPAQDPFIKSPEIYLAPDGLHPSSAGYKLWFDRIHEAL